MFRVLVTSAGYKHSIAVQKALKVGLPDVFLAAYDRAWNLSKLYPYADDHVIHADLRSILRTYPYDLVIPIGAKDVRIVLDTVPEKAVLPSRDSLESCLNKARTIALAKQLGVPVPKTAQVRSVAELQDIHVGFPCVVKPVCETEAKFVSYVTDSVELEALSAKLSGFLECESKCGVLVQEYVEGQGVGFFALYDRGEPVRIFMHKRIREYPVSGGASTCARAFYHPTLKEYGLRMLTALRWHGIAMVEFKHISATDEFVLMEINPKFWGSFQLSMWAGVDFAPALVRIYRGESLSYSENYDQNKVFCWPLDNDLRNLWETRAFSSIKDYFSEYTATNMFESWKADTWKCLRGLKKLLCSSQRWRKSNSQKAWDGPGKP